MKKINKKMKKKRKNEEKQMKLKKTKKNKKTKTIWNKYGKKVWETFTEMINVTRHMKDTTVSGQTYFCGACDKVLSRAENRNRHEAPWPAEYAVNTSTEWTT